MAGFSVVALCLAGSQVSCQQHARTTPASDAAPKRADGAKAIEAAKVVPAVADAGPPGAAVHGPAVHGPIGDEPTDPQTGDHVVSRTHKAMGTIMTLTAWAEDDGKVVTAFDRAFAEFDRIDQLMTTWTAESDVARINAAAGDGTPVQVSPEVILVLQHAAEGARLSGGAFDVTVGAFSGVWKFDEDRDGSIPDPALVAERRKLVDWHDVIVDPKKNTARLRRKGQRITLGGIAKGYAVDRAAGLLRAAGLVDFIVQAGGDMFVAGQRGARRWRVGIRDPRGARDDYFAFAEVQDMTFSTSGDYERFVVRDGKRYHHILDPATGYPAMLTRSVTVMARDALTADELSKGFFILGPEKGMALVEQLPDVEAVFVGADNKVTISSGLTGKLKIIHPPTDGI